MPVNETGNYFSSWSAEKTVYILDTPVVSWNNDLELDGEANNNLTWNAVNAAAGYTVRLVDPNGKEEIESFSTAQMAFAYAYTVVGKYSVEVNATAATDSADYYDSKYSEAYTIERLAAPKQAAQDFIVSNKDSLAEGFTVNFVPVSGAAGYQLYKDGAPLDGKSTTGTAIKVTDVVDRSAIAEQHITYTVYSTGSYNASRREVKLPCLSEDALSFDITVLAVPQSPEMSGFTLSWDSVSNANGYSVSYAGQTVTAQGETYDLSTLNAGTYSVTACARGNGANVLASNFSSPVEIQRLEAPTNIRITADNNGTIDWDDVANAKSYQVFLDLSENALDADALENMYQYIRTDGTTVNVLSWANYYNDNHTLYYMTSQKSLTQQFIRLAAPEFPEGVFADSNLMVWNTPSNINTSEYTPTYRLYSAKGEQIGGGDANGTRFDISYLAGGRSHTFLVKAIGNDTKYLDSDYSVSITVYKLAKPEFSVDTVNGQYVWNAVANASSYYMEIDGVKVTADFHVSGTTYAYTPRYTEIGDHIVTLKAIGDARNNLDSAAYTYTQNTKGLIAPVISYKYSDVSVVNGGRIIVTITTPSANCKNYQYEVAGQSNVSSALSFEKTMQSAGTYSIKVKALGGSFDDDGVYYVDSLYAGGNDEYKITLLAQPGNFSINSDGVIKWKDVQNHLGYEYQISYDGGEFGETASIGYSALDPISDYRQYKTITIRVRAKGNDSNVISSGWSEWTWTNIG